MAGRDGIGLFRKKFNLRIGAGYEGRLRIEFTGGFAM